MISFIIFITCLVSAGIWLFATRKKMYGEPVKDRYGDMDIPFNVMWLVKPIALVVFGIIISLIQPVVVERVDAGHVGIKVNLTGDDRGVSSYEYETGWVFYITWFEDLYEFPTFQQHIEYGNQQVITKGGFSATINPTFNYSLKPDAVGDMFSALRLDVKSIEQGWLKTAIVGSVNDVANRWTVDDIFNKREEFEQAITTECNKRVSKWFTVSQLRTNITPPPALQDAITEKTRAIQEAQAKDQAAVTAESEARRKIAVAKGDSAEAVINASGRANARLIEAESEAKAIKLKQSEVSALYIEYVKTLKWDGVLPVTVLGSGVPMINLK